MENKIENINYDGIWWLSNLKETKVHGSLSITDKGEAILNLVSPIEKNNHNGDRYELIFGYSNNGRFISLQYCLVNKTPAVYPGLKTQIISAENVYITRNNHYNPSEKIDEVVVQFTYLNDWLELPLFKLDVEKPNNDRTIYNITHSPPIEKEISFDVKEIKVNLKICYGFGENGYQYDSSTKITAEYFIESGLKIKLNQALDVDEWYKRILNPIREFIMLATLNPNWISSLSAFNLINGRKIPIKIFSRQIVTSRLNQEIYPHKMLFSFKSIKKDLSSIIQKWFDLYHIFGHIFNAYFSTIQSSNMYLEHKFLTLAQTTEAYHRISNPSKKIKMTNGKKRKLYFPERLIDLLHNTDYCGISLGSNKYEGYAEFLEQHPPEDSWHHRVMSEIICDTEYFCYTVRDTRNYLTHLDETNKKYKANTQNLLIIIDQLSALIQTLILTNLDISEQNVFSQYKANKFRLLSKKLKT